MQRGMGLMFELIDRCSLGDGGMRLLQMDWELAQNLDELVSPTFIVNNGEILLGVDMQKLRMIFE